MATRMQQRRGTADQWISTNSGDGPILEVGEIGFESNTGKFKIGDGVSHWVDLDYFIDESDIDGITGDYVLANTLGQANGVATLDSSGKLTASQLPTIDELSQDAVAQALVNGTHTNITVTYDDNSNTISLVGAQTYSDENAVDAVAQALANGTHTNISVSYNDAGNAISLTGASSLPSQTGNGGKFLSTNGTSDSWNYVKVPTGTSESAGPAEGQFFFNINSNSLKIYAGGAWLTIGSVSMDNGGPFTSTFETSYDGGSAGVEPTSPQFDGGSYV